MTLTILGVGERSQLEFPLKPASPGRHCYAATRKPLLHCNSQRKPMTSNSSIGRRGTVPLRRLVKRLVIQNGMGQLVQGPR